MVAISLAESENEITLLPVCVTERIFLKITASCNSQADELILVAASMVSNQLTNLLAVDLGTRVKKIIIINQAFVAS